MIEKHGKRSCITECLTLTFAALSPAGLSSEAKFDVEVSAAAIVVSSLSLRRMSRHTIRH